MYAYADTEISRALSALYRKDTKYNNPKMMGKPEERKTIDTTLFTLEITHLKKEHEQRQYTE
jgi:hypothetical protein